MRVFAEAADVEKVAVGVGAHTQVEFIANWCLVALMHLMAWNVVALREGRKGNLILERH